MKKLSTFAIICLLFLASSFAQDLSVLKGEKTFKIEYNYDNMIVGKKSESD
jgi:hypothetical protein